MVRGAASHGESGEESRNLLDGDSYRPDDESNEENGGIENPVYSGKPTSAPVVSRIVKSADNSVTNNSGNNPSSSQNVPIETGDPGGGGDKKENVDEDEEKEYPSISYFSLYRYTSCCERFILVLGIIAAAFIGVVPALANMTFGKFTKAMVEKGSNLSCPPVKSDSTSLFMNEVESFVIWQCGLGLCQGVLGYIFVTCFNSIAENQVNTIRKKYFESLLRQDISWFDKNAKRDFSSRLVEDMLKIQDSISEKVGMLVTYCFNSIFLIAISFFYGWKLSLALTVFFPMSFLTTWLNTNVSKTMTEKEQNAYSKAGAIAEEVLTNIKTVNAFNGQAKEINRYDQEILKAKAVAIRKQIFVGVGNGLNWFTWYASCAYAYWYGAQLVLNSRETGDGLYGPDNILVIFFSILMAGYYIGDSSQYFTSIAEGTGAAKGIFPILNRESEIDSLSTEGLKPNPRAEGLIEFEHVEFSYPTRPSVKILSDLNLVIKPGQTVALVGTSGCGKSTCISLLQRFYNPVNGLIKVDGFDIKDLNVSWLRSQCGVVGQEPVLFNATIAENIAFGLENVAQDDMIKASKIAFAHDFIMQLPSGYDTPAGERGTQLSGGQKQRIAIARALVRNPPILLLDEATSALDFQSESIVQAALERARLGRTTIIIAHRLSTIKAADVVVAIDKGEVKEKGSHNELMGLKGLYYKLVMSQEDKEELILNPEDVLEEELENKDTVEEETSVFTHKRSASVSPSPSKFRSISRSRLISEASLDESVKENEISTKVLIPEQKGTLWRLWKLNAQDWPYLLGVVVCSLIKGLQLPVYSIIFGQFIQIFTLKDDFEVKQQGNYFALFYTVIAVIIGLDGFLQNMLVGIWGEKFTYRTRKQVFASMLDQDMTFYDEPENTVGNLCARLSTDATSLRGVTGSRLCGVIQATTIVLAAGGMSLFLIPKLSAVSMIFVPIMIYAAFVEGRVLGSDNVVEKESIENSCNLAVEALSNIRTVASLCAEKQFLELYNQALADSHRINKRRSHIRGFAYSLSNCGSYFCYSLSMLYGGYLVENECISIGNVFTVTEALIFCTTSGGAALAIAPDYDKGKIAAARIFKLLDRIPLISRLSTNLGLDSASSEGKVEFERVNFNYKNRPSIQVLKNMNLLANPGGNIALVGSSGSGKSTCAALILRLYDPTSGELRFDDVNIATLGVDHLRQQIAIVSQEPVLFDYTIAENIAYGDTTRDVPMAEIIQAARMANIHDFISALPAGYETKVGSLGNQLSGGQKQRVAIARALIRAPKLLVLDEATSALDTESEKVVQEALEVARTGRTCITIAHRLSSIQHSDQILVMKNGSLRESGTHAELLKLEGGVYRDMWFAQKLQVDDQNKDSDSSESSESE